MFVVFFFYLFWKFGGFLLNVVIASIFGSGNETDAYMLAFNSVIFLIYGIVLKFFMPAFVPIFMETMDKEGEEEAWRFASGATSLLSVGLIVVAIVGIVFAPKIMWTVGQGFFRSIDDPRAAMTVSWVRIMFPGLIGMCVGVFTYGLLNSYKIFSYPAAGDACQKIFWALSLFVLVALMGRNGVAIPIGFLVGVVVQLIVNFMGLKSKLRFYRPVVQIVSLRRLATEIGILVAFVALFLAVIYGVPDIRGNSKILLLVFVIVAMAHLLFFWLRVRKRTSLIGRFAALAAPLLIGILVAKARDVLTDNFTTEAALPGLLSDKKYAEKVGQLPSVLVGYALAIAMLPYLCDMAAKKSLQALGRVVDRACRMMALFFIPLSVIMAVLARDIMQLVYDRGFFDPRHLHYGGLALTIYISGLFFYAVENVLMQSFFSLQRTWIPTLAGLIASICHVAFLFACDHFFTLTGPGAGPEAMDRLFLVVMFSFPLSRGLKNILLFSLLRWQIPILPVLPTAKFLAKLSVVCVVVWFATRAGSKAIKTVLDPNNMKGRHVVVDVFKETGAAANWQAGPNTRIRVENIRKPDEEPELALRIDGQSVSRDLRPFDLSKTNTLTFKVKTECKHKLEVHLYAAPHDATRTFDVNATGKRQKYTLQFNAAEMKNLSQVNFIVHGNGAIWLDNIEFTRDFPPLKRVAFEAVKFMVAGVPALIGLAVLIAGAFFLRIEEMFLILTWLREEGLDKIKRRLKGGGGDAQTPSAPGS